MASRDVKKEWAQEHSRSMFGLFSLGWVHYYSQEHHWVSMVPIYFGIVATFLAQLILPVLFLFHLWDMTKQKEGFCTIEEIEQKKPDQLKWAIFAIALIYASRLNILNKKFFNDYTHEHFAKFNQDSLLVTLCVADASWSMTWKGGVYILNLWSLMVNADAVQDMIFNCLAAEFLIQIDRELLDAYWEIYGGDGDAMNVLEKRNDLSEAVQEKTGQSMGTWTRLIWWSSWIWSLFLGVVAHVTIIAGPICKAMEGIPKIE